MVPTVRPSIAALVGVGLIASTAVPAAPFSVSATNTASPGSQTLRFDQFDSALGTLTELDVSASTQTCVAPFGSATCTPTGSARWDGTLVVNYAFTPAGQVPEPATFALLGLGLAGLGFARRKRYAVALQTTKPSGKLGFVFRAPGY